MKSKQLVVAFTLIAISHFALAACATATVPSATGEVAVQTGYDENVRIVQPSARREGDTLAVDGKVLRKKMHGRLVPKGHIDITVVDGAGQTIYHTQARYSPDILPRRDGRMAEFTARLPLRVPQGSRVSVRYHSGMHES